MRKLVNWVSGARGHDQRNKTKAGDPSLKDLCVMCLDLEKNTAFYKCGHFGFCSKCTKDHAGHECLQVRSAAC